MVLRCSLVLAAVLALLTPAGPPSTPITSPHALQGWNDGAVTWNPTTSVEWQARDARQYSQIQLQAVRQERGDGVVVAVIDTGVDLDHPALAGALDLEAAWDLVSRDARPDDLPGGAYSGHGTAVAGVVHAVAPGATILPLRASDTNGAGPDARVAQAVDLAVARGAHVINLSLGSVTRGRLLAAAVARADRRGVIVVCSSGNRGAARADFPAAEARERELVVAVGSVDPDDVKSTFSNYGDTEVSANGERLLTLAPGGTTRATGTSFAAPQVSGLLALALSRGLTPHDAVRALVRGADPLDVVPGNAPWAGRLGVRANAARFLPRP